MQARSEKQTLLHCVIPSTAAPIRPVCRRVRSISRSARIGVAKSQVVTTPAAANETIEGLTSSEEAPKTPRSGIGAKSLKISRCSIVPIRCQKSEMGPKRSARPQRRLSCALW
jgi:hypothetical protein